MLTIYHSCLKQNDNNGPPCGGSREEIKRAVFSLTKGKASGPDSFPSKFYQTFWDIIEPQMLQAIWAFQNNTLDLWRLNKSAITVIPKFQGASLLDDFRLISVISAIPKIIFKLLTDRLQRELPKLIHANQMTVIKGRSLMETFIVAREADTLTHQHKRLSVLFKVDFCKAFDTVAWDFLLSLLKELGFPERWALWIHNIIISSSSLVKVNGYHGTSFYHIRGLRQGDPLSSLLFILVVDTLQTLLNRVKPLLYSTPTLTLSAHQFADDTILLSDVHPQNLKVLIEVLKRYATLTGLTINSTKSVLIPITIPTTHWEVVQGIMGCPIKHPLIKYLGLPLSVKKSTKLDYLSLLQKVQGRFRGSIGKWLSKG
jgi:Reverse transcriptase (RNA-dependent DNA polymerase)